MKADNRRTLIDRLIRLSDEFPSMRLGQLICNLTTQAGRMEPSGIWDVEDEELLQAAQEWLEFRQNQLSTQS
jgi:hypothetical protein